jgi:hypothetical protein
MRDKNIYIFVPHFLFNVSLDERYVEANIRISVAARAEMDAAFGRFA